MTSSGTLSVSAIEVGVAVAIITAIILTVAVAAARHWFGQIQKQLVPNGGSSMRDAVNRMEKRQRKQGREIRLLQERLYQHVVTAGDLAPRPPVDLAGTTE